jgi:hypothetical protein
MIVELYSASAACMEWRKEGEISVAGPKSQARQRLLYVPVLACRQHRGEDIKQNDNMREVSIPVFLSPELCGKCPWGTEQPGVQMEAWKSPLLYSRFEQVMGSALGCYSMHIH